MSDLALIRVLPSLKDEVNAAVWHPRPGHGIVYGTKEGRVRILRPDGASPAEACSSSSSNSNRGGSVGALGGQGASVLTQQRDADGGLAAPNS